MRLVFLDLETSGLDHSRHSIIQIAAIAVDEQLNELASIERKVAFRLEDADVKALEANSYDPAVWAKEAVEPGMAIGQLSAFLKRYADVQMTSKAGKPYSVAQLVGHNAASFDGPFLQAFYKRHDAFLPASYRVMCTLQRAIWYWHEMSEVTPPPDYKLGTLCDCLGIRLDNAHDALADVRATVALYKALTSKVLN